MFSSGSGPRTSTIQRRVKSMIIKSTDIDPYIHETMGEFMSDLRKRLNLKEDGLGDILHDIKCNTEIDPRHSPSAINKIKRVIQPHITGNIFWTCDGDKDICQYCHDYMSLSSCEGCNTISVSYDVDVVDDLYLNLSSSTNKQVSKFLTELQGNVNYSQDEWTRISLKLDDFFDTNCVFNESRELIGGVLEGTTANLMRDALGGIDECNNDSSVYYACIYYWGWNVFDFSRYVDAYREYTSKIDYACNNSDAKLNKMFKYYWVSLIIGFDISRHYFRIPRGGSFIALKSRAKHISRNRGIPIPRKWKV